MTDERVFELSTSRDDNPRALDLSRIARLYEVPVELLTGVSSEGVMGEWPAGQIALPEVHDWRSAVWSWPDWSNVRLGDELQLPTGAEVRVSRGWGAPFPEWVTVTLIEATGHACPVCHLVGGFHDTDNPDGFHALARRRIGTGLYLAAAKRRAAERERRQERTDQEIEELRAERRARRGDQR